MRESIRVAPDGLGWVPHHLLELPLATTSRGNLLKLSSVQLSTEVLGCQPKSFRSIPLRHYTNVWLAIFAFLGLVCLSVYRTLVLLLLTI